MSITIYPAQQYKPERSYVAVSRRIARDGDEYFKARFGNDFYEVFSNAMLVIALMVVILALAWSADATADTTMYVHVRDGTYLNGRHDATKDSAVEMRLYRGDAVEVVALDSEWAEIVGGEAGTCWCCVDYLADYPPDTNAQKYTVVSNGRVRVRQSPEGNTERYLQDGDTVEVRFVVDGWACLVDGGYVMAEYLATKE